MSERDIITVGCQFANDLLFEMMKKLDTLKGPAIFAQSPPLFIIFLRRNKLGALKMQPELCLLKDLPTHFFLMYPRLSEDCFSIFSTTVLQILMRDSKRGLNNFAIFLLYVICVVPAVLRNTVE